MLVPDKVNAKVAAPDWVAVNPPVPLMPPEKVVSAVMVVVRLLLPRVMEPAPDRLPIVSLLESAKVAPLATVTAPELLIALPPLTVKVPASMLVVPV